jgi:hypothetical protein
MAFDYFSLDACLIVSWLCYSITGDGYDVVQMHSNNRDAPCVAGISGIQFTCCGALRSKFDDCASLAS